VMTRAIEALPLAPAQATGGARFAPSHVNPTGISPPSSKAVLVTVIPPVEPAVGRSWPPPPPEHAASASATTERRASAQLRRRRIPDPGQVRDRVHHPFWRPGGRAEGLRAELPRPHEHPRQATGLRRQDVVLDVVAHHGDAGRLEPEDADARREERR